MLSVAPCNEVFAVHFFKSQLPQESWHSKDSVGYHLKEQIECVTVARRSHDHSISRDKRRAYANNIFASLFIISKIYGSV